MAGRVLLKIAYLLVRRILGLAVLVFRGDRAKDAELLILRHENAVLRRHAGRVRYEPTDRVWFAALARLLPRGRWAEIFPVTPATLLAWHRRLAAKKYDTSKRRKPGRSPTARSIGRLAVWLAQDNPLWGIPPDQRRGDEARPRRRAVHTEVNARYISHDRVPASAPDLRKFVMSKATTCGNAIEPYAKPC